MREIKFRVWDILNKRILNYGEIMTLPMWEVLPGTPEQRAFNVMQYTGLKDKNGKEIYEGDIIKHKYNSTKTVWFKNGAFVMSHENSNIHLLYDLIIEDGHLMDWDVVGNIYEKEKYRC